MEKRGYKKKIRIWEKRHPVTTALTVGLALIFFWRGVWMLMDIYLFPKNLTLSATISIIAGILILYLRDFDLEELYENR